jgi:hypothetical protein
MIGFWILGEERRAERCRQGTEAEHLRRAPAVAGGLDDRVDRRGQGPGHERRADPVDAAGGRVRVVARDQRSAQENRRDPDGKVDEEDPVPAERLREHASRQQAQRPAGDGDEHVGAHRAGAVSGRGELRDDDRQDHGRLDGGTGALEEARADQHALTGRDPAQCRSGGEDDNAREEHAPAAEEVAQPARQQQQAAERDQERVHNPGQIALREAQVALDRRQRYVHDRGVQDNHQLRQADDHERQPAALNRGKK